jgi:hypothetical protein
VQDISGVYQEGLREIRGRVESWSRKNQLYIVASVWRFAQITGIRILLPVNGGGDHAEKRNV